MSSDTKYRQIVKLVTEKPWAIMPETLAAIRDVVALRANGERLSEEEIRERIGAGPASRSASRAGSVAVIPVYGAIVPKATLFSQISGGTSVQGFRDSFLGAVGDSDVGAIVLDVDSPGGLSDLLPELASTMRRARGKKPVLAVANTLMASAAYWIGSQADEVAVTPSGLAGSIGVFAAHDDLSGLQEKLGVKTTLISAGRFKTDGNPFEPLTDEARAHIQQLVDATYAAFTSDVARGRGVSVEDVRAGFGEGRVLTAKAAVDAGLADRVASLEDTIQRAASLAAGANGGQAAVTAATPITISDGYIIPSTSDSDPDVPASFADDVERVVRAAETLVNQGRRLTAAKRRNLETLSERLGEVIALGDKDPLTLTEDHEKVFAALEAAVR